MFKIAILGCENSHADAFLRLVKEDPGFSDVEVVGVYSNEPEANERMRTNFGVYCAESYDEFVGKLDGVVITARDGKNHYKYAKPYIDAGIPMFIDKPITCDEQEALTFARELKSHGCRVAGGSSCKHAPLVRTLANGVSSGEYGKIYGAFLRAPISMVNDYSGFYFYSQHLAEVMQCILGRYPESVTAFTSGNVITVNVKYDDYNATIEYVDGNYDYYAYLSTEKGIVGDKYTVNEQLYKPEFNEFYKLLKGEEQQISYKDFISTVNILCAIERSINGNSEERVNPVGEV